MSFLFHNTMKSTNSFQCMDVIQNCKFTTVIYNSKLQHVIVIHKINLQIALLV